MSRESLNNVVKEAPSIIREAAAKPLGIVALVVLGLAVLASVFFWNAQEPVRVGIFVLLVLAASMLLAFIIRTAQHKENDEPTKIVSQPVTNAPGP